MGLKVKTPTTKSTVASAQSLGLTALGAIVYNYLSKRFPVLSGKVGLLVSLTGFIVSRAAFNDQSPTEEAINSVLLGMGVKSALDIGNMYGRELQAASATTEGLSGVLAQHASMALTQGRSLPQGELNNVISLLDQAGIQYPAESSFSAV